MAVDQAPDRIRLIRRIIQEERIETQRDLVRALRSRGIAVTQATVSRDIKRLGLVKVPSADGRSRYALPGVTPVPSNAGQRLRAVMAEFGRQVVVALDLVLVKTERGGAQPVAQAIDDVQWPDVAGTLAGEDTIIVVPAARAAREPVAKRLRALLPAERAR